MNKFALAGGILAVLGSVFGVLLLVVPEFVEVFLVVDGKASDCTIGYLGVYEAGFDAESCLDAQTLQASGLDSIPTNTGVDTTSFPLLFPYATDFIKVIHPLYETTLASQPALIDTFFPSSEGKTCEEYYDALQGPQSTLWQSTRGNSVNLVGGQRQDINAAIGGAASAVVDIANSAIFGLFRNDPSLGGVAPLLAGLFQGADSFFDGLGDFFGFGANTTEWALTDSATCQVQMLTLNGAAGSVTYAGTPVAAVITAVTSAMNATCCQSGLVSFLSMEQCLGLIYGAPASLVMPGDGAAIFLETNFSGICATVGLSSPCTIPEIADVSVNIIAAYNAAVSTPEGALLESAWRTIDALMKHGGNAIATVTSTVPVGVNGTTLYGLLKQQEALCAAVGADALLCPYESKSAAVGQTDLTCSILKATNGGNVINPGWIPNGQGQNGCTFLDLVQPRVNGGVGSLLNEVLTLGGSGSASIVAIGGLFVECALATPTLNYATCWDYFNAYIIDATYSFGLGNQPYIDNGVTGMYDAAKDACADDNLDAAAIETAQSLGPAGVAVVGLGALAGIFGAFVNKPVVAVVSGVLSIVGAVLLLSALLVVYNAPVYASVGGDAADLEDYTPLYQSGTSLLYGLIAIALGALGGILLIASPKCGGDADSKETKVLGSPEDKTVSL